MRQKTVLRAVLSAGLLLTAASVGLTDAAADDASAPSAATGRQAPASDALLTA
ncbi:S1 family peptidase, partial [Streptomyces sp. SID5998]|nr:S1 family peptidase [Streptomyces sp. SID5998]